MSNTITITLPSDLATGETAFIDFGGDRPPTPTGIKDIPKDGWLAKRGPFDGVVFDSYSDLRLRGSADGMDSGIPANSARTLDSNPVSQFITVTNPSSNSATLSAADMEVILFGPQEQPEERGVKRAQFAGAQAVIADMLPGVRTNGQR